MSIHLTGYGSNRKNNKYVVLNTLFILIVNELNATIKKLIRPDKIKYMLLIRDTLNIKIRKS